MNDTVTPSLAETHDEIWHLLETHLRRDTTPRQFVTLASCDTRGAPQLRMVALRKLNRDLALLEIHTDTLSHKVEEIRADPRVSVLAWAPEPRVQLRLSGLAQIETGDPLREVWETLPPAGRLNYSHLPAPGSRIAASDAYVQRPDFARFARITIRLSDVDYVSLADSGHRRARFQRSDGWAGEWLSP